MRVAVDAMGGDDAPGCVVEGARLAIERGILRADQVLLVGRQEAIEPLLAEQGVEGVAIVDAREIVAMNESPAAAIRTKKDSSISRGMRAVSEGEAQAFVSAGNTGAVVAAASLILGRLPGVARPGIAVPVPTRAGPCAVIDVGANIFCKPIHMVQYAVMAGVYASAALGHDKPRVGLLNIGEEEGKGNPLIQEVHGLLQQAPIHYAGFVEGQDLMSGLVHVVVCEGFVGNVILKVAEGIGGFMRDQVYTAFEAHPPRPDVGQAIAKAFRSLDYAEYGGAPLLGVGAPVLIGHGRSSGHAMMNMLRAAASSVEHHVNEHITERLAAVGESAGS